MGGGGMYWEKYGWRLSVTSEVWCVLRDVAEQRRSEKYI